MNGQVRIEKTTLVDKPLTYTQWCKKYKVGSRIEKNPLPIDMYKSGEYDFDKLVSMIKNQKPSLYDRITDFLKIA